MKRYITFSYLVLLSIYSCYKEPNEPTKPSIDLPPKSITITAVETDSGVNVSWFKTNMPDSIILDFEIWRGKEPSMGLILSPWTGDYIWYTDSKQKIFLDQAPPFSSQNSYKVIANLLNGEKIASNVVSIELEHAYFLKNYQTVESYHDPVNSTVFVNDAYSKKIRLLNYGTKEYSIESNKETEMYNGGGLISASTGNINELYAITNLYGQLNIFDSKTLQFKKTLSLRSSNMVTRNGLMYLSSYPNLSVMRISDNTIIQTSNYYPWYGDMMLALIPNSNKLIGVSRSVPNKIREFILNSDGTIQSQKDVIPPSGVVKDSVYGFTFDIHPSNGTIIGGFRGSIYDASTFTFQNSLNLSFNPGVQAKYSFSPDGKYLAVSTTNALSPVTIYSVPSRIKKYSFDITDCIVQNMWWKDNYLIIVANTKSSDYIKGTVLVKRKVPL